MERPSQESACPARTASQPRPRSGQGPPPSAGPASSAKPAATVSTSALARSSTISSIPPTSFNAVLWRLRYKLSLRDVAELLLVRGFSVTHETIREWEGRFAPLLAARLREKRRGRRSVSWYLDETYVKVAGRWRYLYRAIDGDGNLLDSLLSEHRDRHAARRFLRQLLDLNGRRPLRARGAV